MDCMVNGQITPTVISDDDDVMIRSFGTRILRFNRETKFTKTVHKLSKNSRSYKGGGQSHHRPPPEYATAPDPNEPTHDLPLINFV